MADIRQAGMWIQERKLVRRSSWAPGVYYGSKDSSFKIYLYDGTGVPEVAFFAAGDLLAEDWEIFEWLN